ncbi:MAG: hypothetical protein KC486_08320 [Myxococcales bacterium]|nr:hypothetical protein [Myxococcales bacterium]
MSASASAPTLRPGDLRCFLLVGLTGAILAPLGDHFHVATGVTEYLVDFGPRWFGRSPLWFTLLVAPYMGALAVVQGRLTGPAARSGTDAAARPSAWVWSAPLLVLGLYLMSSFYPSREGGVLEVLMFAAAAALYLAFDRSRRGLALALAAAVLASATELALINLGVFRYLPDSAELFGVAPWLVALYFAAAVAVGALGRRLIPAAPSAAR